ncbi:hypothetical protein OF376_01215 [Ureaplasma miroungigenitalium]|uniref:Lipoprotein n=1 Tax=Ureaplasma miroungigenitalium TaxID=1042321 RepID=A0ABT3BMD0_9BACT|nr:hypothetical protein [Ureaplasma miroungigenitalium]MCV3728386.1 hypothetical protein [Ureaplasma miroungigenitalium]MCV3734173.1 hypothetical protein [Ureaplasma miroungigenitalium]
MKKSQKIKLLFTGLLTASALVAGTVAVASCQNTSSSKRLYHLAKSANPEDKFVPIYHVVVYIPKVIHQVSKEVILSEKDVQEAVFQVTSKSVQTTNKQDNYLKKEMLFDLHRDNEDFYRVYLDLPVKTNVSAKQTFKVTSNLKGYENIIEFTLSMDDFDNVIDLEGLRVSHENLEQLEADSTSVKNAIKLFNEFHKLMQKHFRNYTTLLQADFSLNKEQATFLKSYKDAYKAVRALKGKEYKINGINVDYNQMLFTIRSIFTNDTQYKLWMKALETFINQIDTLQKNIPEYDQLKTLATQATTDEASKNAYNKIIDEIYLACKIEQLKDTDLFKQMIVHAFSKKA